MQDPCWEQALSELNGGKPDASLWAQCLAAAKANRSLAEMQYLRDRSKQLADEQREQERSNRKRDDDAHLSQAMRIVESLPKGNCSNCKAVVLLAAQACPKCAVSFEAGSGHCILPLEG